MPNKEQNTLKQIFKVHLSKLKHTKVPHKKVLICFSGIPCTGKTNLSKIIENKYKGVRTGTDDIRKIIKKLGQKNPKLLDEKYKEEILHKYLYQLLKKYPFINKLIILDRGIERDYKKIFPLAKKYKFKLFIIRIKATKETAKKGVIKKLGKPDKNFTENIDRWVKEYKQFNKTHSPNITINSSINKPFNTDKLFHALNKIIK